MLNFVEICVLFHHSWDYRIIFCEIETKIQNSLAWLCTVRLESRKMGVEHLVTHYLEWATVPLTSILPGSPHASKNGGPMMGMIPHDVEGKTAIQPLIHSSQLSGRKPYSN